VAPQASPPALTSDGVTLLGSDPGMVSFFAFENITIVVWHGKPNPGSVDQLTRVSERRRKANPHGVSVIHLVQGQWELPDSATREAFVRLMKDGDGQLAVVSVVIGGSGFWASAVRSLVTGFRVLARGSFDMGLHGEISEVVSWLPARHTARTGVAVKSEQLERVLTFAQSHVQPSAA
jgi:hypothetical protein